jgi:S-adenosylmethionine:tRNA ribosyltransferase-isomerase
MKTKEFSFNLPEHLIAQFPSESRGESRLLVLDRKTGHCTDSHIADIANFFEFGSVLVVNNSKVRKARVYAESESGGRVEFLFLHELPDNTWTAMVTKSKRQRIGKRYTFSNAQQEVWKAEIIGDHEEGKVVRFDTPIDEYFFSTCGHVPLPPYIKRDDAIADESRYQTVYAESAGSVAAPTAGLHFTDSILETIKQKGITLCPVTLHVGPGTFLPVRTEELDDHPMHVEHYEIPNDSADIINKAKQNGRKIIAVGTTSVRTLESAFDSERGELSSGRGSTRLFIRPPYQFHVVDQLVTNFHTPESTLLVLVSAFAGKEHIFSAYQHAIEHTYRFFSYGDAMFIR